MTQEEFLALCISAISKYGFKKSEENKYILEKKQQQRVIINGFEKIIEGPSTKYVLEFIEGSKEIRADGTEEGLENVRLTINEDQEIEVIYNYNDFKDFESLLQNVFGY